MVGPSPKKTDKWGNKTSNEEAKPDAKHKQMIPPSRHQPVGPHSNLNTRTSTSPDEPRRARSLNMEEIKKIRVIQIDPPKEKKYRRAE